MRIDILAVTLQKATVVSLGLTPVDGYHLYRLPHIKRSALAQLRRGSFQKGWLVSKFTMTAAIGTGI